MATITRPLGPIAQYTGYRSISTFLELDTIPVVERFEGLKIRVEDASADLRVSAGAAEYTWHAAAARWMLTFVERRPDEAHIVTETFAIVNGEVEATYPPKDGIVFDAMIFDPITNDLLALIPSCTCTNKVISIGSTNFYDGKTLQISYFYGFLQDYIDRVMAVAENVKVVAVPGIADLQQAAQAVAAKVDKAPGKGLSTEDFTADLKDKLVNLSKADVGLLDVDNTADIDKPVSTAQAQAIATKVDKVTGKGLSTEDFTAELKGIVERLNVHATGNVSDLTNDLNFQTDIQVQALLAGLNTAIQTSLDSKLDISQAPLIGDGIWNASTNTPTLVSSVGTKGHFRIVTVAGTTNIDGETKWKVGDWIMFDGDKWILVLNESPDFSALNAAIATKVDIVVGKGLSTEDFTTALKNKLAGLAKADVGLSAVDNTADTDKPVSTAQAAALSAKFNLAGGALTGPVTSSSTLADKDGNLRQNVIQSNKTAAYTLATTDNGSNVNITTGGVTIPATGVLAANFVSSIYNQSGAAQNITFPAGYTVYLAGVTTAKLTAAGSVILAGRGVVTVLYITATEILLSGVGLS
jgi:hypothetical protein